MLTPNQKRTFVARRNRLIRDQETTSTRRFGTSMSVPRIVELCLSRPPHQLCCDLAPRPYPF
jgi:hypothetical protein